MTVHLRTESIEESNSSEGAFFRATGGLKSTTSLTPGASGAAFRRSPSFDSLERRYLLSADISPYTDAIDDGLDRLQHIVDEIAEYEEMAADIPVLGESLAELGSLSDTIQTMLDDFSAVINGAAVNDTFEDLVEDINLIDGVSVTRDEDSLGARYDIAFSDILVDAGNTFDLGVAGLTAGVSFENAFSFSTDVTFDFGIGVLFDPALSPSESVYIRNDSFLELSGAADFSALLAGSIDVGLLGGAEVSGSASMTATARATLSEGATTGAGITIAELDAAGLALVGDLTTSGDLTADLNVSADATVLAGLDLSDAGITIGLDGDIFENPKVTVQIDTPELADFTRLNTASLLGFVADLGAKLELLSAKFNEIAEISFIDINVGDFTDFDGAVRQLIESLSIPGLVSQAPIDFDALSAFASGSTIDVSWETFNGEAGSVPIPGSGSIDLEDLAAGAFDSLEDFAAGLSGLFSGASIPITVAVESGVLVFRASAEFVTDFSLTGVAANVAEALLIQNDQTALPLPTFETIQEFAAALEASDLFGGAANLTFDEASKTLKFDLDLEYSPFGFDRTLAFNEALDLGVFGELALAGSATVDITSDLALNLGAGFDLTELTGTTPVSSLNGGTGIGTVSGDDFYIVTLDKSGPGADGEYAIDLDLGPAATLQDIIDAIETATGGKVTAAPGPFGSSLVLTDTTSPAPGDTEAAFAIMRANDSPALYDLGFALGVAAPDQGNVISGGAIIDRFYIDADSSASADVTMSIEDVNLFGAIGFIALEIRDGGTSVPINFGLELALQDVVGGDDRLYLSELALTEEVGTGADASVEFSAVNLADTGFASTTIEGELELPVFVSDGGTLGLDGEDPVVTITIGFETGSIVPNVETDFSGLEDLMNTLSNLGASDLLTLVSQIAGTVFDKIDLLNADLPFLDSSIADLVSFVEDAVDGIAGEAAQRINDELVYRIDAILGALDPARAEELLAEWAGEIDADLFDELEALLQTPPLSSGDLTAIAEAEGAHLLFMALEELKAQILNIGGAFDFFFSDAPSKLIAAFAALRDAVKKVSDDLSGAAQDAFDDVIGAQTEIIEDIVPSTRTILRLVQEALGFELPRIDQTLAELDAGLLEDVKAEIRQIIVDATSAYSDVSELAEDTLAELQTKAEDLNEAAQAEIADAVAKLDRLGEDLRDLLAAASDSFADADALLDATIADLVGAAADLLDDVADAARTSAEDLLAAIADLEDTDVTNIDDVRTLLEDFIAFLSDEDLENSLADIVERLRAIASTGEDIFDLIQEVPDITAMLADLKGQVEAVVGSTLDDLRVYLDTEADAALATLDALRSQAVDMAENAIEQFRAAVLGFFNGGLVQFDYEDGRLMANLSIAPSIFDVQIGGAGFDFTIGDGKFVSAGVEDVEIDFSLGGVFDLGLALQFDAGLLPGSADDYAPTQFDLLVDRNSEFELNASLTVDGKVAVNLGGVGFYFENLADEPEIELTDLSGDGPAFLRVFVDGPGADPLISITDAELGFEAQAMVSGALYGFFNDDSAILWDDDNDENSDDVQIDIVFGLSVSVVDGEFFFDFDDASNALEAGELLAIASGLLDFSNLLAAFETILDLVIDFTDSLSDAPLIGGPLDALNDLLVDFQTAYETMKTFLEGVEETAGDVAETVQGIIFDAVGDYLDADVMRDNFIDGEVDGVEEFTANDILLSFVRGEGIETAINLSPLYFQFGFEDLLLPFDFGLDAWAIEVAGSGAVSVDLLINFAMGLGLSTGRGAYLILPDADDDGVVDPIVSGTFAAHLVPDEGEDEAVLAFRLFFLGLEAVVWDEYYDDEVATDPDAALEDKVGIGRGVGFDTGLSLGLVDGSGTAVTGATAGVEAVSDTDDNLSINILDLGDFSIDVNFGIAVNADFELTGGITTGDFAIDNLPNITALMNVDWIWSAGEEVQSPGVQFYDVSLDLGEWAKNALGPLLDFIGDFTAPLDPFFEFLDLEIPILSQLAQLFGQDPITVLDAIKILGSGIESVETVINILNTIKTVKETIDGLAETGGIEFGDFIVTDGYGAVEQAQTAGLLEGSDPGDITVAFSDLDLSDTTQRNRLGNTDIATKTEARDQTEIEGDTGDTERSGILGVFDDMGEFGLDIPLLRDPSNLFGLLLGQRVDFIVWDIPRLAAEFGVSYKFGPILPPVPLFVTIGGGFEIFVDLSVGYDSRGLETGDFWDGFYFGDVEYLKDDGGFVGEDILELGLSVYFEATASLSVVVAEAGVTGGVEAEIGANWADDNGDGKFYLDEIAAKLQQGILCIFDLEGALEAYLEAFVKLGFDTPFGFVTLFQDSFELLRVTLLDFTVSCPPLPAPQLGTVTGDTGSGDIIDLNIGGRAGERQPGAGADDDVKLEIFGDRITENAADEVSLWAGANDTERMASYDAAVAAGLFSDGKLTHEEAAAAIRNGATYFNLDLLDPSGDGDIDTDEITAVRDLNGVTGDNAAGWALVIGFGEWEVFNDAAVIIGLSGGGDDTILGDPESLKVALYIDGAGGEDEIIGGLYDDILFGGAGEDIVRGFGGNDTLHGDGSLTRDGDGVSWSSVEAAGDGADNVFGGGGSDSMWGGDLNDTLKGDGETPPDPDNIYTAFVAAATDGSDWIRGQGGEDAMTGSIGDDTLLGDGGADNIDGNEGNDSIEGGAETDLIQGGTGADYIEGNSGDDIIFGEEDGFVLAGETPTDQNDTIYGGSGEDDIRGQIGNDSIFGGSEDDRIIGGAGEDTIFGGTGNDDIWGDRRPEDGLADQTAAEEGKADGAELGQDSIEGNAGRDTIRGGLGADSIIGGSSGAGATGDVGDLIRAGAGDDVVLGDDGYITDGETYATNTTASGGNDTIYGADGDDQIAGGRGDDIVFGDNVGGTGQDILFGDEIVRDGGMLTGAWNSGGTDGEDILLGYGNSDLIVGGGAGDFGSGSGGDDLIVGDYAKILLRDSAVLGLFDRIDWVLSIDPDKGADDRLIGDTGSDIVIGGADGDYISGGGASDGDDILLGDNGLVLRDAAGVGTLANDVYALYGNIGGADEIFGGAGEDLIIGGNDDDTIVGGSGDDVAFGDAGLILRDAEGDIEKAVSTFAEIDTSADYGTSVDVGTGALQIGTTIDAASRAIGDDSLDGGANSDVLIGGLGLDLIYGRAGDDVMLGDNGEVDYDDEGTGLVHIDLVRTLGTNGDVDALFGEGDSDIGFGGAAGDLIFGDLTAPLNPAAPRFTFGTFSDVANPSNDVLAGDFGSLTFYDGGLPSVLLSSDEMYGGRDLIEGHEGNDVILGGADGDALHGEASAARMGKLSAVDGDDVILGDSGRVHWIVPASAAVVAQVRTTAPDKGGRDFIFGNDGDDILMGGAMGDFVYGDRNADVDLTVAVINPLALSSVTKATSPGYDRMLGDNGLVDFFPTTDTVQNRFDITQAVDLAAANAILITTQSPTIGGDDLMIGGQMDDLMFGGTGSDRIWGDDAGSFATIGSDVFGNDTILGDHGKAYQRPGDGLLVGDDYYAIDTAEDQGGLGDVIFGEAGDDVALGQQGDDIIFGGLGDDNLIGGHNTATGADELTALFGAQRLAIDPTVLEDLNPTDLPGLNDIISGDEGDDLIAGDNAYIVAAGSIANPGGGSLDPRLRTYADGETLYDTTGQPVNVNGVGSFFVDTGFAPNLGPVWDGQSASLKRNLFLLDFDAEVEMGALNKVGHAFGDDIIAGGENDDRIYGGLGDDIIQGDGDIAIVANEEDVTAFNPAGLDASFQPDVAFTLQPVLSFADTVADDAEMFGLAFVVASAATDGDDYVEGNGGNDRIYGNLGQDDLVGGSSEFAAIALNASSGTAAGTNGEGLRPDGADMIFGGAADADWLKRNAAHDDLVAPDPNIAADNFHTADADVIVGDNANIYRMVQSDGTSKRFEYAEGDGYGNDTAEGALSRLDDQLKIRTVELLDYVYTIASEGNGPTLDWKTTFNDFGVGAGDLIHGESGDDIVFGMTGDDVIFGEAGDDDLYGQAGADILFGGRGVDGLMGDDGLFSTSRNGLTEPLIGLDTANEQDIIRTPGNLQIALIHRTGDLLKNATMIAFDLDGVDFGTDWAAREVTSANDIIFGGWENDFIHSGDGDDAVSGAEALPLYYAAKDTTFDAVNTLLEALQAEGANAPAPADHPFWRSFALVNPGDVLRFGATDDEEFALYDEDDPRSKILVSGGGLSNVDFLLNNDAGDGLKDDTFPDERIQNVTEFFTDGADHLFGDLGNDWIVGGTGRDHMFGGRGNDLIQMDDDLDRDGGSNTDPDPLQKYADIAYDGAGRDYLILNTGADRAIGWVGEYNSYIVPFSPFGAFQIARLLQPHTEQFVLDLARASGSDESTPDILRFAEQYAQDNKLDNPLDPDVYDERHGSPFNELGMVRQEDFDWQQQSGPPDDPQAGNDKGPRKIMRREIWEGGMTQSDLNKLEASDWYLVEQAFADQWGDDNRLELIGKLRLEGGVQSFGELSNEDVEYSEVTLTTSVEIERTRKSEEANAYLLFDLVDDDNFRFAGIDIQTGMVVIGQVIDGVWSVLSASDYKLASGRSYDIDVTLKGGMVTLALDGDDVLAYSFADDATDGGYGIAATGAKANFKDIVIAGTPEIEVATEEATGTALLSTEVVLPAVNEEELVVEWETAATTTTEPLVVSDTEIVQSSDVPDAPETEVVVESWTPREDFVASA